MILYKLFSLDKPEKKLVKESFIREEIYEYISEFVFGRKISDSDVKDLDDSHKLNATLASSNFNLIKTEIEMVPYPNTKKVHSFRITKKNYYNVINSPHVIKKSIEREKYSITFVTNNINEFPDFIGAKSPMKMEKWWFSYDSLYIKDNSLHSPRYYYFNTYDTKLLYDLIFYLENGIMNQKENLDSLNKMLTNKEITQEEYDIIEYNILKLDYNSFKLDYNVDILGVNLWDREDYSIRKPYLELRVHFGENIPINHSESFLVNEDFIKDYCKVGREFYKEKERYHFLTW